MSEKRAVCLNCMDGRVQLPVIHWIKEEHGVEYVDMITEPGIDGMLADTRVSIGTIEEKLKISIVKNNASIIFVAGHHDCKGNLVSDDEHKNHITAAVTRLKAEFTGINILGLWVNQEWKVELIT